MSTLEHEMIDYMSGKWITAPTEHRCKFISQVIIGVDKRIEKLMKDLSDFIGESMKETVTNRKFKTEILDEKISVIKEEVYMHFYHLSEIKRKVEKQIQESKSPSIMNLRLMDKPFGSKKKSLVNMNNSSLYEKHENSHILENLETCKKTVDDLIDNVEIMREIWLEILDLYEIYDAKILIKNMKDINEKLKILNPRLIIAFFQFDDATRALVKIETKIKFNLGDALNKLTDYILRNLLRCIDNYKDSNEADLISKVLDRLSKLKLQDSRNIDVLMDLKMLLETEPKNFSYETCYRKIGELQANLRYKQFKISSLFYLTKYFYPETVEITEKMMASLKYIRERMIIDKSINLNCYDKLLNRNIAELQIYCQVVEELLMECEPGKNYFFLNDKLYQLRNMIAGKHYTLDREKLEIHLETLGSEEFNEFIRLVYFFTVALKEEKNREIRRTQHNENEIPRNEIAHDVDSKDLEIVALRLGKVWTKDERNLEKIIDEILASCGTLLANTFHTLLMEILKNMENTHPQRHSIWTTYENIEKYLKYLNAEN